MRIFLTGGSGHIGSAVVPELVDAGHRVVALARSESSASVVEDLGAEALRGEVGDLDLMRDTARQADATIHLAFDNEAVLAGDLAGASDADLEVARAFGDALSGTGKAFVAVGIGPTGDAAVDATLEQNPRFAVPSAIADFADDDVRSVLVGVPPVVHSPRDRIGFIPTLIGIARRTGTSGYIAEGANHWPAVHTLDLGRLFRLAVEDAPAGAQIYGAAEDDVTTREIAEVIRRRLGLPSGTVPIGQVAEHFGGFAMIMGLDFPPMVSLETRNLLDWEPTQPGVLADLEEGHYFSRQGRDDADPQRSPASA